MSTAERFGRNLFMARRRAGLTQQELATLSRLHLTEIGMLERGKRSPRLSTILKLMDGLDVEAGVLLEGIGWPHERRD